ncbi:MAG: NAD(P)/FAD-dependent oxidoreductase [Nitrospirota bacterium]
MRADVVVIGGGPAGNYAAGRLAASGLSVTVLEEHRVIGEPRFCTGILGARAFEDYPLPRRAIQGALRSATIYSPSGRSVRIARPTPQAYIMDRARFDQLLAEEANGRGARYRLGSRAVGLEAGPREVRIEVQHGGRRQIIRADCCLLATGSNRRLHAMAGLAAPPRYLDCVQAEFAARACGEVEVFVGQSVAPGSFGWAAPVARDRVRIGVCVMGSALSYFHRLIASPRLAERLGEPVSPIRKRRVPIAPVARSVADRVLLVGDAAGQVKPLTGGGIYYSIVCADLAARAVAGAAADGDFSARRLGGYEREWRALIGRNLTVSRYTRRLLAWSSDEQFDALVELFQADEVQALLARHADFDAHHHFFAALFRLPSFWTTIARRIARGAPPPSVPEPMVSAPAVPS